jgi:hypothetical protein
MDKGREIYFSVNHNVDDAKAEIVLEGSKDLFSLMFSSKTYVNELDDENYSEARKMIINTTLNICNEDKNVRDKLLKALKEQN